MDRVGASLQTRQRTQDEVVEKYMRDNKIDSVVREEISSIGSKTFHIGEVEDVIVGLTNLLKRRRFIIDFEWRMEYEEDEEQSLKEKEVRWSGIEALHLKTRVEIATILLGLLVKDRYAVGIKWTVGADHVLLLLSDKERSAGDMISRIWITSDRSPR